MDYIEETAMEWDKLHHAHEPMESGISGYSKAGGRMMDFYSRIVWARDPTCEGYMIRLASNLWFLTPTFPDWSKP